MQYEFAPMEGVAGAVYRRVHHQFFPGADRYMTPFLTPTQNHCFSRKEEREIAPDPTMTAPVVPQLLTRNAEDFLWAAQQLSQKGYREVNLNLGCPSATVVTKGKGAGLLADPDALDRFLDTVFAHAPLSISIKTRLGLQREEEWAPLLEIFNRYPLSQLIVHPRLREDYYRAPVHLPAFWATACHCRAPLSYNGDLRSTEDIAAIIRRAPGLHGVMIGRGLLINPALLRQAKGGAAATRGELWRFHQHLAAAYCVAFGTERNAMLHMKELWLYQTQLFEPAAAWEKALKKASSLVQFQSVLAEIFQSLPLRQPPSLLFPTAAP